MNPMRQLFKEKNINVSAFARTIGVSPQSIYTVMKETSTVWRMGIDLFMKIANGLGMTADELYEELEKRKQTIEYGVVTVDREDTVEVGEDD